MEKDLLNGKIGKEGSYELEMKDGKLRFTIGYDGQGVDSGLYVDLEPEYFLDKLADAIPGNIDDAIIAAIKGALK